ncbi:MAG: DUF4258 domain-containing protein [Collimonas pratensis]
MSTSKHQWEKLIRGIAQDTARISFSRHALGQMRARKITLSMALDVLRKGKIELEPEVDMKTGHTCCRMERYTAGKAVAVVVACEDEHAPDCIVVTAFVVRS